MLKVRESYSAIRFSPFTALCQNPSSDNFGLKFKPLAGLFLRFTLSPLSPMNDKCTPSVPMFSKVKCFVPARYHRVNQQFPPLLSRLPIPPPPEFSCVPGSFAPNTICGVHDFHQPSFHSRRRP